MADTLSNFNQTQFVIYISKYHDKQALMILRVHHEIFLINDNIFIVLTYYF